MRAGEEFHTSGDPEHKVIKRLQVKLTEEKENEGGGQNRRKKRDEGRK